jgi:PAS domain S-box-containing protein
MKPKAWQGLVSKYQAALSAYVAAGSEEHLQRAYDIGRSALNEGLGVIDISRLHHEAFLKLVVEQNLVATAAVVKAVEAFFMEALSPFEVAHRGFRDACDRLQRLNVTLAERNRELGEEIVSRKNAQDELQESESKFRSVVESAQDGIITIDAHGRIVGLNPSAEVLFGYRSEELLGKAVTKIVPRPLRAAALFSLKCLVSGSIQEYLKRPIQSTGLHRDGSEFSLEFTLAVWRTRSGMLFTGVIRDIRERMAAEKALRESREHYIRLFEESKAMQESLRKLSSKVLTVQEEERKHISRELHDEIGQALTAVNVSIAMLRTHAGGDEEFRKKVDQAQRLLEQSMDHVHRFARELRPSMLDHLGPYAALKNYVKSFAERTGIKAEVESTAQLDQLDNQQGTVLYRVAQESLTNVFKHAHATRVKIRFHQLPSAVCMEVSDNGRSFVPPEGPDGKARQPLGLLGMQERVRLVNGEFAIESIPKRGTTVRVQIPISSEPPADSKVEPAGSAAN